MFAITLTSTAETWVPTGCVSWSFDKKGVIVIDNEDEELDEEDTVIEDRRWRPARPTLAAGRGHLHGLYSSRTMLHRRRRGALRQVTALAAPRRWKWCRRTTITLTDEGDIKNMSKMLEMFDDNEDVQNVWHNWENEE